MRNLISILTCVFCFWGCDIRGCSDEKEQIKDATTDTSVSINIVDDAGSEDSNSEDANSDKICTDSQSDQL